LCQFEDKIGDLGNLLKNVCEVEEVTPTLPCDEKDPDELWIKNLPPNITEKDIDGIWAKNITFPRFPINLGNRFWNLKDLDFDGCGLDRLRSSYFTGLDFLLNMKFKNNKLKKLSGRLFRGQRWLRNVDFGGNLDLKNIGFQLFNNLRYIRKIDLSNIGCGSFQETNSALINAFASKLFGSCPPDPEDLENDLNNMECEFKADAPDSSSSKKGSKGN
jgi:hypothetical protein